MPQPRPSPQLALLGLTLFSALALLACRSEVPSESQPAESSSRVSSAPVLCGIGCVVVSQVVPLIPSVQADSVESAVSIGETRIEGKEGGRVTVEMLAGPRFRIDEDLMLLVRVGGLSTVQIPVRQTKQPVEVFRFSEDGTITVAYSVTRSRAGVATGPLEMEIRQITSRAVTVAASTPLAGRGGIQGPLQFPGIHRRVPSTPRGNTATSTLVGRLHTIHLLPGDPTVSRALAAPEHHLRLP